MRPAVAILAAVLLAGACAAPPSTLTLEAARVAPWRTSPERLLVALPGSASAHTGPIQLGAALRRELAACGIDADVVTDPADAELSLKADSIERAVNQRLSRFRPDGLLLVVPRAVRMRSADFPGQATTTYAVGLTELTTRAATLRAVAQFNQHSTADAEMPKLGRLLVREMASAGAIRCPGQRA